MASTLVKSAILKITADDGDTEAKLDLIQAKADELAHDHPELKVKIDSAAASAKLAVLRSDFKNSVRDVEKDAAAAAKQVADETARAAKDTEKEAARAAAKIAADAKRATASMASDAKKAGDSAGQGFMSRFGSWLKPSKFQLITSAVALGLAALPAAVGGLGALAGIALAAGLLIGTKKSEGPLYTQFHSMLSGITTIFRSAAAPLVKPLAAGFTQIGKLAEELGPRLRGLFASLGPMVTPFVSALRGLVLGIMPGLVDMLKAAQPAVTVLSRLFSGLGSDIGHMFADFAPAMHASGAVLLGLGDILNGVLPVVGKLAGSLASALGPAFLAFGNAVRALSPVLGAVGAILGKLAGAVLNSLTGALSAIADLAKAAAPAFGVLAAALGRVFNIMENSGVFGILEDSLENIARPLGRLISSLVTGLAPILPLVLGAVSKVSAALAGGLAAAILALLPGLQKVVAIIAKFSSQALVPLLPQLANLMQALINVSVQALVPLLGPLMNLVVLLVRLMADALTPLIPVITFVVHALADLVQWFADVAGFVAKLVGWIVNFSVHMSEMVTGVGRAGSSMRQMFEAFAAAAINVLADVIRWFIGLPGKILHALGDLNSLLISAGRNVIEGLINGVKSQIGGLMSIIGGIGHDIAGAFKSVMGIFSPSKVFAQFGQQIVQGLTLGLGQSGAAKAAAKQLAADVVKAFKDGTITGTQRSALEQFITGDDSRLKTLAAERDKILKRLQAEQRYAASVRTSAEQGAGLASISPPSGKKLTGREIITGLQADLANIRKFNRAIEKLEKLGLDRQLLGQIIAMGPGQGLAYAEALLAGPVSRIYNLNKTEKSIESSSWHLGRTATAAMYNGGKQAGKGFITGLEEQAAAIRRLMERIAKDMVRTLRKELGISSPSKVMHQHGLMIGQGLADGIDASRPKILAAAQRMARAVSGGQRPALAGGYGAAAYGPQRVIVEFDFTGADAATITFLKKAVRVRGGDPAVFGR